MQIFRPKMGPGGRPEAWYCIVGFGARAVSRKTFIYFTVMIVKTEVCFEKTKPSVFGELKFGSNSYKKSGRRITPIHVHANF